MDCDRSRRLVIPDGLHPHTENADSGAVTAAESRVSPGARSTAHLLSSHTLLLSTESTLPFTIASVGSPPCTRKQCMPSAGRPGDVGMSWTDYCQGGPWRWGWSGLQLALSVKGN